MTGNGANEEGPATDQIYGLRKFGLRYDASTNREIHEAIF